MREYLLLLGTDSYLRERALAGARQATSLPVWNVLPDQVRVNNRYFDGCIKANPQDQHAMLAAIHEAAVTTGYRPSAVVPVNDWSLRQATFLNAALGLNGLSDEVTRNTRSKFLMKQKLQEHDVPTARACLINSPTQLDAALEEIGMPVVIKPVDFGGSGGVSLARTSAEALAALQFAMDMMAEYGEVYAVDTAHFMVEQFIETEEEVSVEVLCYGQNYQAVAVTEKYLSPLPYFAEIGHVVPSHRSDDPALRHLACAACRALGITLGVAHVEIKINGNQHYVIELAARPGGDAIMDLVETAYEENMYKRHIMAYLGNNPLFEAMPSPVRTAAVAFLKAEEGEIVAINEPCTVPPEVVSLEISGKVGQVSEASKCWRSREGVVQFCWPEVGTTRRDDFIATAASLSKQIFASRRAS